MFVLLFEVLHFLLCDAISMHYIQNRFHKQDGLTCLENAILFIFSPLESRIHSLQTGADLEIFDRGGPIEYPLLIYQNSGPTKIVLTKYLSK